MKSLRERLAQFDRSGPRPDPVRRDDDPLAALVAAGACWVGGPPTGHLRHEQVLEPLGRDDAFDDATCPRLADVRPTGDRWTVLDTETTGLESGTGTIVFLVGLLHWTPTERRRVQLFLPEPAGEAGLLRAVAAELDGSGLLITYNGRSFDVPRLRTRMRLQRLDAEALERPHLDLVHPARRLLRGWLDARRQIDLERELLGQSREDDLPGSHAPEVYRALLADGRDVGLRGVMEHNARDVDRLCALAAWFARAVAPEASVVPEVDLAAARLLARRGRWDEAEPRLRRLVDGPPGGTSTAARRLLADGLRRQRRYEEAAQQWRRIAETAPHDVEAFVEWAKLCEHRLRDFDQAQDVVRRALRAATDRRTLDPSSPAVHADLVHRLRRIERRRGRGGIDARFG